jgi:hypothetical protein
MNTLCLGSVTFSLSRIRIREKKDGEEVAVIEIGAAPSRNLKDRTSSFGPTAAVEVSPIENWLELEAGVDAELPAPHNRLGDRPFVQEALDAFAHSRVHGRHWPRVDKHKRVRHNYKFSRWGSRPGLHILA